MALLLRLLIVTSPVIAFAPVTVPGVDFGVTIPLALGLLLLVWFGVFAADRLAAIGTLLNWFLSPLAIWIAVTAVLLPVVFEGTTVYRTQDGLTELGLSALNGQHLGQLAVFAAIAALIGRAASRTDGRRLVSRALVFSGWVAAGFGALQVSIAAAGLDDVAGVVFNNPSFRHHYDQTIAGVPRLASSLVEPSYAAAFFSAHVAFCVGLRIKASSAVRSRTLDLSILIGLVSLLATLSTTAIIGLLSLTAALTFARSGGSRTRRRARAALLGAIVVLIVGLQIVGGFAFNIVESQTVDKTDSASAAARRIGEETSAQTLLDTFGLGAGWGSSDAFSLTSLVLVGLGAPGVLLLAATVWRRRSSWSTSAEGYAARFALVVGALTTAATVSQYVLWHYWVLIGIGVAATDRQEHSHRSAPEVEVARPRVPA